MGKIRELKLARQFKFGLAAARSRFHLHDLDLNDPQKSRQLQDARGKMRSMLSKKGVPSKDAEREIQASLQFAGAQRYARAGQVLLQHQRNAATQNLELLVVRLEQLSQAISNAPPATAEAVDKIMTAHAAQFFDTESFLELIQSIKEVLPISTAEDQEGDIWQDIIISWEGMPSVTRTVVEAELRGAAQTRNPSEFFPALITLLKGLPPPKNKKAALTREFSRQMAMIWRSLGLHVGAAHDWKNGKDVHSVFERFCAAALRAVGDDTKLSRRQVKKLQKDQRENRPN